MQEILNNLEYLRTLSGNAQISVLNDLKTDLFKEILIYTYDPHRKYKIDESKLNRFYTGQCGEQQLQEGSWNMFVYSFLNHLADIKSAKDDDVKELADWLCNFNQQTQDFFKMVLFKDLRLNMSIKKFQKVWPDFCVEPQVQLAVAKEDRSDFELSYYSRKYDGKRVYILDGMPYSRSNKECSIPPMEHILNQLQNCDKIKDLVLDGECLYFENGIEDFQKGISLCQRDERANGCDNICYVIFDAINKDCFLTKTPYKPFKNEYEELLSNLADFTKQSPCYSLIPTYFDNIYIAKQDTDPCELFKLCKQNSWEGIMCRDGNSPYEYKRTNKLLKIKQMHDTEVVLTSMEEGTGKHAGRLGAFHANYKGFDLKIGSGFTDEQREKYWNNKEQYLGKTIKVQYFEKTTNAQGGESLRFPVYLCFRDLNTMEEYT